MIVESPQSPEAQKAAILEKMDALADDLETLSSLTSALYTAEDAEVFESMEGMTLPEGEEKQEQLFKEITSQLEAVMTGCEVYERRKAELEALKAMFRGEASEYPRATSGIEALLGGGDGPYEAVSKTLGLYSEIEDELRAA